MLKSGTIEFANGDTFIGEIKDYNPHGKGRIFYNRSPPELYDGEFYKGMKYGKGSYAKLKSPGLDKNSTLKLNLGIFNSEIFDWMHTGEFEEDEVNGHGKLETHEQILQGYFFNSDLEGDFEIIKKTQ